jgi:predicted Zn-ribbon and HTH transcriptional regulator
LTKALGFIIMSSMETYKGRVLMCLKCRYRWTARKEDRPTACPSCKSYRWDELLKKEIKEKTR